MEDFGLIQTNVNASNITALSMRASFGEAARRKKIPTVAKQIEIIKSDFDLRIESYSGDKVVQNNFKNLKEKFIDLVERPKPDGYELAVVSVDPFVGKQVLEATYDEYLGGVNNEFNKYIAKYHVDELYALDMNEYNIDLMREAGFMISSLVGARNDHLAERGSHYYLSTVSAEDGINEYRSTPSLWVNHFYNLHFMPDGIHKEKNELKDVQTPLYSSKKPHYLMMLMPSADPLYSGFVSQPQRVENYKIKHLDNYVTALEVARFMRTYNGRESFLKEGGQACTKVVAREIKHLVMQAQDTRRSADEAQLRRFMNNNYVYDLWKTAEVKESPATEQLSNSITAFKNHVAKLEERSRPPKRNKHGQVIKPSFVNA